MKELDTTQRDRSVFIGTEVTPDVRAAIEEIARDEDRSISYMTWKLLEESPRVKNKLKQLARQAA